jgi:hypothetical protein
MMPPAESCHSYALRYAAAGFAVFPLFGVVEVDGHLRCRCADPECRSQGKHPMTPHGVKDASTDPAVINAWFAQWPQANLGMALGGPARRCVIDTDPRNGGDVTFETLIEHHGALPDTALQMTGGGGTHHLFIAPEGARLPGKLGKGVDLKGEGGYIVVAPSLHVAGVAYTWEASSDPLEGQAIAPLPAWVAEAGPAATTPIVAPAAVGFMPPQQVLEVRSALAFVDPDDRNDWLAMGMALKSTAAPNAFGLWTEWSMLSPKFDPADQRRVWNSFKSSGRNLETIFAVAAQRGWVNPASRDAQRFSDDVEAAIERANTPSRVELVEPASAPEPAGFPAPALNELATWINGRYALTHPAVTTQTVLAIAALAASRVYVGEGGTPCHLCLGVVAESSMLTAYARDAVSRVLDAVGLRRMMRGTRANAPSNVYSTLWRSPAAIHVVGDYGHLAQFAKRQPSGVLDQAFSVMADAYSASALYVDSAVEAGLKPSSTDDQLVVRNPALTTLLLSTHEQMGALLQRGELTRGLLVYQLPVIVATDGAIERLPVGGDLPAALHDLLLAVRRLPAARGDKSQQEIFGGQPCLKPNLVRVRQASPFDEHVAAINAVSAEPAHRPLVLAAIGTARRMCTAIAPWLDPHAPTVTRDVMDWVCGYVLRHLGAWLEQYSTLGNDEGRADIGQKIVAAIADRKTRGIPRGQLHKYCWVYRNIRDSERRAKVIDGLIEDGELVEVTPEGTRQKVLVAGRFARRVELKVVK